MFFLKDRQSLKFKEFSKVNMELWKKYFSRLFSNISSRNLKLGTGKLLYPNLALFTETNNHFILELLGVTKDFTGLKPFLHKYPSTSQYLGQFETQQEAPIFNFAARNNGICTLLLSNEADLQAVRSRFGFVTDQWQTRLNRVGANGALFSFADTFQSCFINNCLIVNKQGEIYRVKYILHAVIVHKKHPKEKYASDLLNRLDKPLRTTNDLYGVHYIPKPPYEDFALSGQFANLFLLPKLREPRIGEFLKKHPLFIRRALSCKNCLYNKKFKWIEGNPDPEEEYIQPDLMLEREDGFFDICDLKTAALDKQRVTKGRHRRRRFIDYVEEGVAQLANYEEYFRFKRNAEWSWSKHKVKVNNPNLILVVGSYENASKAEINEATRKLKPNYQIIDYDTLNSLFLRRT